MPKHGEARRVPKPARYTERIELSTLLPRLDERN